MGTSYEEHARLRRQFQDDERMTYERFQASAKGVDEVRAFLNHTLGMGGGWKGSRWTRSFFLHSDPQEMWISAVRDFSTMAPEDFWKVTLGGISHADLVERLLCEL